MGYAVQDDLVQRYHAGELIQLTDRGEPPTGAIVAAVVTRALEDADAIIDSYIGARYDLPLASTPPILKEKACEIARFKLYDDAATEEVRKRYEEAIRWLRDVSKGDAVIDVGGQEPPASAQLGIAEVSAPDRVFTGATLKDFTG